MYPVGMKPGPSATAASATRDWSAYFDAVADAGPRETLVDAADRFDSEGFVDRTDPPLAVDLGCGTGRDTLELLRRGWRVLAIDGETEAIGRLLARPELAALDAGPRLETCVCGFAEMDVPPCGLVNASFALPFCAPDAFASVWARIRDALVPGGRFAGHFLGDRDDWASLEDRTHHTRDEVDRLLEGLAVERLDVEISGPDPADRLPKRWHVFHVVARRPDSPGSSGSRASS